jgi:uncharacterized protein YdhG (YjbR/CyaY superfamily)
LSKLTPSKIPSDVDSYISAAPKVAQGKLSELRELIKAAAPQAEEIISYRMPYYKYHGHLVGFAAYKDHVSLFGAFPKQLEQELKPYKTGKGSVQFPLDKPLPKALIEKIIKAHVKMNEERTRIH